MNRTLKWILIAAGALLLVFFVVRLTLKQRNEGLKVTAENVKRRTIVETVSASGKLYPETEIKVGSPINGEVTQLTIQEGDTVSKGQVLARIQGEKNAAAPRLSLPADVPPGFEGILQNMQPPRAATGPSSATIKAPISGTVFSLSVKKGERVGAMQMPGSEMLRVADMTHLEVRVDVNENNIIKIAVGDSAEVEVEAYNKRKFRGTVTSITNSSSRRDPASFLSNDATNYEVHIRLIPASYADLFDSSRRRSLPFRPGMNARADIKTKRRENVLSVPVGAVVSRPSVDEEKTETGSDTKEEELPADENNNDGDDLQEVVFVIGKDGTVKKRVVTTGIQDISYFEITGGLKEGERVVTAPYSAVSKTLRSGTNVSVVSKEQIFQHE